MLKFLSSVKLAVFLIASIAGMSIVATMVDNTATYSSWPFRGLLLLFMLNLSLCTIKLLPQLGRTWKRTVGDLSASTEGFIVVPVAADQVANTEILAFLQANRYKISQEDQGTTRKILATKGKISLLAPHLLHIAIFVVLVGAFLTSAFSESGGVFAYVGQSAPLTTAVRQVIGDHSAEKQTPGAKGDDYIEVLDFQTVYDQKGEVDNWVTRFNLTIDGVQVVTDGETKVNYPYRYKNMLIYQNSYGKHFLAEIKGAGAEIDSAYSLPDSEHLKISDNKELMLMDLGQDKTLLKVFETIDGQESVVLGRTMKLGDIVEILPGTTIEYLGTNPYTVLETKVSSGTNVVFLGFILATLASMLFWSGRYRELQVVVDGQNNVLRVLCVCKNKMIVENTMAQLEAYFLKEDDK